MKQVVYKIVVLIQCFLDGDDVITEILYSSRWCDIVFSLSPNRKLGVDDLRLFSHREEL